MATKTLMTVGQFLQLPDDDEPRYELVDGELIEMGETTIRQNRIRLLLLMALSSFVRERKLDPDSHAMIIPQLVVEVSSSANSFSGLLRKAVEYQRAGVRTVWIVNDEPLEIHVYEGSKRYIVRAGEKLQAPTLLPGFSLDASELVAR